MISNVQSSPQHVVYTNKAQCRDCYRCVRMCPVKAIRMQDGQAYVEPSRCIACGTCVRECPQGAKSVRDDVEIARRLLTKDTRSAVSLAPSFAAAFPAWQHGRLVAALRRLGFGYVGETAIGAAHVARATAEFVHRKSNRSHVCTACPAVVSYVERYRPQLVDALVPVASPMIAHARHIRRTLGDHVKVVFIGPCVAKKAEAERPEHHGVVDCALTFAELRRWLQAEDIDLAACEESAFDERPTGNAQLFPLEGGCIRTMGWTADVLDARVLPVSGFHEIGEALGSLDETAQPLVIEPLFCSRGCVNGPAMETDRNAFSRRKRVLDYARQSDDIPAAAPNAAGLATSFRRVAVDETREISEEAIRHVLHKTGKAADENQLNCGACGYSTCREKAIAVLRGLAEPEMCLPYMKRLAEQRVDRIIETSPNGIVILDDRLHILGMNPAFRRYFQCSETVCGRPIAHLMDPEPFERLATGEEQLVERTVTHKKYDLVCHQVHYPLPEDKQYVGIFVNVTNTQSSQRKLDELRTQTVLQARELLNQQMHLAETVATALGESTARGEALLDRLMLLAEQQEHDDESTAASRTGKRWLRDTYMSKPS
jgi:iron only hydrogenase large subunit-like protein/uncharacterized Fe-S cluster-containing protein